MLFAGSSKENNRSYLVLTINVPLTEYASLVDADAKLVMTSSESVTLSPHCTITLRLIPRGHNLVIQNQHRECAGSGWHFHEIEIRTD